MNFYKMSRSGINSQGRLSSPNRERKIINRHVFTFSTKPITCRERQRIEPKCKTHVQRHCFRSLPLPSWLRKLPDTTQLFRTSNFIGPVYHAALQTVRRAKGPLLCCLFYCFLRQSEETL